MPLAYVAACCRSYCCSLALPALHGSARSIAEVFRTVGHPLREQAGEALYRYVPLGARFLTPSGKFFSGRAKVKLHLIFRT